MARARPARAAAAVAVILLGSAFVSVVWQSLGLGIVAFALLLLATSEYIFPIRYSITEQAIQCRNLLNYRRLEWKAVRCYFFDGDGIKVTPLTRPSRLETFRGIYLRFPPERAAALSDHVQAMLSDKSQARAFEERPA